MPYPSGKFRSGKNSRIIVEGSTLSHSEWGLDYRGERLDTRNFESEGWDEALIGFRGVDWSTRGLWDAGLNIVDDPPGLYPRDDGEDMECIPATSDLISWQLAFWLCQTSNHRASATGLVEIDASGTSQSVVTPIAGSV